MAKIYVGDKSIENNKLSVGSNDSTYCYVGAVNFYPDPEVIEYIVSDVKVTYLGDSSTCLLANGRSYATIRLTITKRKNNKIAQIISNIFSSTFDIPDAASCMDADGIDWVKYDKTVDAGHLYWNYTDSDVNTRIVETERDVPVQLEYVLQDGHRMFHSVNIRIGTNILCNRYRFKDNLSLPSGSLGTENNPVSPAGDLVYLTGGNLQHQKRWTSGVTDPVSNGWEDIGAHSISVGIVNDNGLLDLTTSQFPLRVASRDANGNVSWIIPDSIAASGYGINGTLISGYPISNWAVRIPTLAKELPNGYNNKLKYELTIGVNSDKDPALNEDKNTVVSANKVTIYQRENSISYSNVYSADVRYDSSYGSMRNQLTSSASTVVVDEDDTEVYIYAKASREVKYASNASSELSNVDPTYLSISKTYGDTLFSVKTSNYSGYKVWKATNITPSTQFAILDTSSSGTVFSGGISVPSYSYVLSLSNTDASYASSTSTYTVDVNSDVSSYKLNIYSTKNGSPYVGSSCIVVSASNSADSVTPGSPSGSNYPVNVGFVKNTNTSESKNHFFTVTQKHGTTKKNEFKVNVRQKMKPHEYGFGIDYGSDLIYELTTPLVYNIKEYTIPINSTKDGVALQPSTSWISLNGNILSSSGISISHPANTPEGFYTIAFNCNTNNTDNVRDTVVTITQKDSSASTGKVITYTIHQQKRPTIELSTTAVSKGYTSQSGTITVGGVSDWNVYKSDTYASWLVVSKTNDSTISWSMTENSSGSRSTSAIVRDGENVVSKTISFSQDGKPGKTDVKLTLYSSGSQLTLNVNMPLPRAVNITYNLTGNISVAPYQVTQYDLYKTINPSDLNSSNSMILARASDWTTPAQWVSITGQIIQISPTSDDNYTYSF